MRTTKILLAAALAVGVVPVQAQTIPGITGPAAGQQGGLSGLAGALGGGLLPNVGSSTIGNLTGVLGYCLKNKLLGSGGAAGVLNGLTGRKGVTSSRDFALGQTGVLQTGSGALPLGNVQNTLRTQICDLVLKQATRLL